MDDNRSKRDDLGDARSPGQHTDLTEMVAWPKAHQLCGGAFVNSSDRKDSSADDKQRLDNIAGFKQCFAFFV
jgi:hypothetical protein